MNDQTTVEVKDAFERVAEEYKITIIYYYCDNGLFDTILFRTSYPFINFCGVNAHHQNSKAERRIKDITPSGHTLLRHASHRWPKAIDSSLWTMTLKHYVNLRNNIRSNYKPGGKKGQRKLPDTFAESPPSKFSGVEIKFNLKHFHPFSSPVYVHDQNLQAQKSHNKWTDHSRVGIFLTLSPVHSRNIPLVLNTSSGNMSPQFHCLYDDGFATCRCDAKFNSIWKTKAKLDRPSKSIVDLSSPTPHTSSTPIQSPLVLPSQHHIHPPVTTLNLPSEFHHSWDHIHSDDSTSNKPATELVLPVETPCLPPPPPLVLPPPPPQPSQTTRLRHTIQAPRRFADSTHSSLLAYTATFTPSVQANEHHILQPTISNFSEPYPLALLASHICTYVVTGPDTMTLKKALSQPDREHFLTAMRTELTDHVTRKHWKVIPIRSVPYHKHCLPIV